MGGRHNSFPLVDTVSEYALSDSCFDAPSLRNYSELVAESMQ